MIGKTTTTEQNQQVLNEMTKLEIEKKQEEQSESKFERMSEEQSSMEEKYEIEVEKKKDRQTDVKDFSLRKIEPNQSLLTRSELKIFYIDDKDQKDDAKLEEELSFVTVRIKENTVDSNVENVNAKHDEDEQTVARRQENILEEKKVEKKKKKI